MLTFKLLVICLFSISMGTTQILASSSVSKKSSSSPSSSSGSSVSYTGFQLGQLSSNMSQFAISLYNNIRHYHDDNMVISPLSIETALALLYCGSGGKTANEMVNALDLYPMTKQQVAGNFSEILGPLSKTHLVAIANAIYIQNGFQIRADFENLSTQDFNSTVQNIDFGDSSTATDTINAWVANKTSNQITSLFGPNALPPSTNLVLANAIYFKGFWQTPFPKANTKTGQFRYGKCKTNEVEPIQMMNVQGPFRYGNFPNLAADIIELPYKHSDLSMLIMLPQTCDGFDQMERELKRVDFSTIDDYMNYGTTCDVTLPKFQIDLSSQLLSPLINMGFSDIFGANANFTDMVITNSTTPPHVPLSLSSFVHKAVIDVTESGTTAAAATGGFVRFMGHPAMIDEVVTFTVDHPFLFMIRDPSSIHFIGRFKK